MEADQSTATMRSYSGRGQRNGPLDLHPAIPRSYRNRRCIKNALSRTVTGVNARRIRSTGSPVQQESAGRLRYGSRMMSKSACLLGSLLWMQAASAVLIPYENCLPDDYIWSAHVENQNETQLQWVPLFVDAKFDLESPNHTLLVTVWGNVTGRVGSGVLPDWNSTDWDNSTLALDGKILNQPDGANLTTLHSKVDVATYTPYSSDKNFCDNVNNGSCPLGPVFSPLV